MSGRENKLRRQQRLARERWARRVVRAAIPPWTSWAAMIARLEERLAALELLGRHVPPPTGFGNRIGHGQAAARAYARKLDEAERGWSRAPGTKGVEIAWKGTA